MRLSKRGAFAIGVVALVACGGSGLAPSSSDSGAVADASDETIIITSDATLPTDGASSDSESPDSSVDGGPQTDGSVNDSAPLVETGPSCEAGTVDCNGVCVNEQTDPNHCGSCTKVCPGPDAGMGMAQCTTGTCSVVCDGTTTLDCSGTCFAPTDPDHCGGCSTVCPGPTNGNGQATCSGATPTCGIACSSGYHVCNGACEPNTDDPSVSGDPCILSSTYGVFVSSTTGSDTTGNGTPSAPYATITHGLAHLGSTTRVYVCDGTYNEQVSVTTSVSLYGALTCAGGDWQYSAGTTANVAPTGGGPALTVSGVSGAVVVEDMTFTSPAATGTDASGNGKSSIAAFVNGSSNVNFLRATLTAEAGAAGSTGIAGSTTPNYTGATAPNGAAGGASGSALGGAVTCQDGNTSTGGSGGVPGAGATPGGSGTAGGWSPVGTATFPFDGAPGTGGVGACPVNAHSGANGSHQAGGSAATTIGSLSNAGWTSTPGTNGVDGDPGQGGGGGGGLGTPNVGGNAGGAGGCGGTGGRGGGGGGASIALASFNSTVTLTTSVLASSTGGTGGEGGTGENGQGGGASDSDSGSGACSGSFGGNGAGGSGGAGGTGGTSAAIVWKGTQPTTDSSTNAHLTAGSLGTPGIAGPAGTGGSNALGTGNGGNPGATGSAGGGGPTAPVIQSP